MMKYVKEYADYEVMSLFSAIRRDRDGWRNWRCLRIAPPSARLPEKTMEDVESLIGAHVSELEGVTFFCATGEILLFCKHISHESLENTGRHILTLFMGIDLPARCDLYDVARDADQLAVLHSYDNLGRIPVLASQQQTSAVMPAEDHFSSARLENAKVLLVEDDPVTRWLVRSALKGECVLSTAPGMQAAISAYRSCKPDVVFLDLNLPDGHGRDVMSEILKSDPGAYIVVFSSHDSMDNIVSMLEGGAKGFVAKPFSRSRLLCHLNAGFMSRSGAIRTSC